MAWYADAIKQHPDGLVTQAQVAEMLGISRMAVSRLVARGYLQAVYFPAPPDVVGVSIAHDDVVRLWENGDAKKKCKTDWNEIIATINKHEQYVDKMKELQSDKKKIANLERKQKGGK